MPIHILSHLPDLTTPSDAWPPGAASQSSAPDAAAKPPLVRHLQRNVLIKFDPPLENSNVGGKGDLYIAESQLIHHNPETTTSICIDCRSIVIHAISREGDPIVRAPCIYCQLEGPSIISEDGTGIGRDVNGNRVRPDGDADMGDAEEEEEEVTMEVRIVPDDAGSCGYPAGRNYFAARGSLFFCLQILAFVVDAIFQALSDCAALHPDPMEDDDEEEEFGEDHQWFTADSNEAEMSDFQEVTDAFPIIRYKSSSNVIKDIQAIQSHLDTVFDRPPAAAQSSGTQQTGQTNGHTDQGQFADADEQAQR
ncbi:hypothetical protein HDV00_010763 [Rhizophlyctis rosea]|nr:hypothetical protein HDV00_010763 [Rhizophlyctis rosea]